MKRLILLLGLILLLAACGENQPAQLSPADQQATVNAAHVDATQQSGGPAPTVPLPTPTQPPATHGTPHIGGPISDFYGKYGQPHNQGIGDSETWIADQQQTVLINASPDANGVAIGMGVTAAADWSDAQTTQYCSQFLPPDASAFNSVGNLTDYHSSVGEIVMQISQASCTLTISQP